MHLDQDTPADRSALESLGQPVTLDSRLPQQTNIVYEGLLATAAAGDLVVGSNSGWAIGSGIGSAMRATSDPLGLPVPNKQPQMLHHASESVEAA